MVLKFFTVFFHVKRKKTKLYSSVWRLRRAILMELLTFVCVCNTLITTADVVLPTCFLTGRVFAQMRKTNTRDCFDDLFFKRLPRALTHPFTNTLHFWSALFGIPSFFLWYGLTLLQQGRALSEGVWLIIDWSLWESAADVATTNILYIAAMLHLTRHALSAAVWPSTQMHTGKLYTCCFWDVVQSADPNVFWPEKQVVEQIRKCPSWSVWGSKRRELLCFWRVLRDRTLFSTSQKFTVNPREAACKTHFKEQKLILIWRTSSLYPSLLWLYRSHTPVTGCRRDYLVVKPLQIVHGL